MGLRRMGSQILAKNNHGEVSPNGLATIFFCTYPILREGCIILTLRAHSARRMGSFAKIWLPPDLI